MLLVSRLSHIRKIVPSCYFGRLKKSSSGKGWYVSSRILRDKNANDIGFCGSIYDKDYGYLKWWTVCIFWIKSFRGEDCDIGADIYISFSTMKLFYLFTGRIVILEILDASYVLLRLTANIVNFEYLSTVKIVTRCVLLHIFRFKFIAKLWFDTHFFKSENRERYRIPFLRSRLRYYERYHGLCFEVKRIRRKVKFTI